MGNIFQKSKMKILSVMVLFTCVFTATIFAEDISVMLELNTRQVLLESYLQIVVRIDGSQDVAPPNMSALTQNFKVEYSGPSSQIMIINGKITKSKSFIYYLYPKQTGSFEIPPIKLSIRGTDYTTQPETIEVVEKLAQPKAPTQPQALPSMAQELEEVVRLEDKLFLNLRVPKNDYYINEQILVKVMLFVSELAVRIPQLPVLENIGFLQEPFDKPDQYQEVLRGKRFDIIEFDTTLYPTRTGDLVLGPTTLDGNMMVERRNSANPYRGSRSLFNDDFFSSFFSVTEKRPFHLESEVVQINVHTLPEEGKPSEFSGAVGNYTFDVQIDSFDVTVGDPIILIMKVQGKGNLNTVKFPKFLDQKNFKIYDPNIKEEGDAKTLEQVIIPRNDQVTELPALQFSYFDTELEKYVTISKGPFPINVQPSEDEGDLSYLANQIKLPLNGKKEFGKDIVYIKESPGSFRRRASQLYKSVLFYLLIVMIVSSFLGAYFYYQQINRLQTDSVYAKKLKAPKFARKGIEHAKKYISQGQKEAFYDELYKTLQQYMANKLHIPLGTVNYEGVKGKLSDLSDQSQLEVIKKIFDECEMIRYASASLSDQNLHESVNRLEMIIDYLEREVK